MKHLLFMLLFSPLLSYSQVKGIKFEEGLSWSEIQIKALRENKYIFMDCYTTWCGPCKFMSQNIFTLPAVGDYFNQNFICVQVQMDETKKDTEEVRKWYGDAILIEKEYSIISYPTYLFFSPNGQAVHRSIGSCSAEELISKGKDSFDPEKQYYTLMYHYSEHKNDSAFLLNALQEARSESDNKNASIIEDLYLASIKDLYSKPNLGILLQMNSSQEKGFKILLYNYEKIDRILGEKGAAEQRIRYIIAKDEIDPSLDNQKEHVNWRLISKKVKSKYPFWADRVISESKVDYYESVGLWRDFKKEIIPYINKYRSQLSAFEYNDRAWTVFKHYSDRRTLLEALKWSKWSIDMSEVSGSGHPYNYVNYIDTYANLFYKTGDTTNAIVWERKAVTIAKNDKIQKKVELYEGIIDKMQRGEETWK
jgi:thioredoxin-related protein